MTKRGMGHPIPFHPAARANLRPFGAPPSRGRREKSLPISPPTPYRHFERSEKSSLHTGQRKDVRGAGNTVLHTTWNDGLPHMYRFPARKKDPSAALGMTKRGWATSHFLSSRCASQPPPLRGTSFQRKEGEAQKPSPYRHFERSEKSSLHTGETESVRQAPERFSEQPHACRTQLGQERPSAALGMTKRGTDYPHSLSFHHVEGCSCGAVYPAPSARPFFKPSRLAAPL